MIKIVHEVQIDLRWSWRKRQRVALIKNLSRLMQVLLLYSFLILCLVFLWITGATEYVVPLATLVVVGLLIVVFRLRAYRRANRAARRRLGPILTQFIEFTQDGVAMGTRHCSSMHVHWDLCRVIWKKTLMDVEVTGYTVPLSLTALNPQHLAQIRYGSTRHQT